MRRKGGSFSGWACLVGLLAASAASGGEVRTGRIEAVSQAGPFTFLEARDFAGGEFLVVTTECRARQGEALVVEQGAKYQDVEVGHLGRRFAEFYVARRLRIGERSVEGLASDALPEGCVKRDPHGDKGGRR